MQIVIVAVLLVIVASLGQALYAMSSGPDRSGQMLKALTVRISLSVGLFALLFAGWALGIIEPHSL
jgi:hypothetical protein